jgi:tetratricopeptide (TPR) repeat protein
MKSTRDTMWIVIITLAAVLVYLNAVRGDFVYDDNRQIAANPLIQDNSAIGKALVSDVWAFKGSGTVAASNYWRPTFTAWCILNYRLFGIDPTGWHVLNLLLHAAVCIVGFFLLRRWNVSAWIAAAIMLLFAVHPVHTESVAWISGSPDLLLALFLLLSLIFADRARESGVGRDLAISVVFYLLALGSKEIAVFCLPVYVIVLAKRKDGSGWSSDLLNQAAWRSAIGFLVAVIAYFLARMGIIGAISRSPEFAPDTTSAILTIPAAFVFYLRQMFFPLWLGPNYSLRPVEAIGLTNFVLPLVIAILVVMGLVYLSAGSFVRRVGLALFLLPLLPAMLIFAFPSDQIVHDRYLYLPLLGFLIVVVDLVAEFVTKRLGDSGERYLLFASVAVGAVLAIQTFSYNRAWLTDLALWKHAVTIDESSPTNWLQLGAELDDQQEPQAAAEAYKRALALRRDPLAVMGASRVAIALGDPDSAIRELETVIDLPPESVTAYTVFQSYEALAIALQQRKDLVGAERRIREARERLPIYRAALTEKLAVILYLQNRKSDALAELEGVRAQARKEMLEASKSVFLRLGMLYAEQGRKPEARAALEEFLASTANSRHKSTLGERRAAAELLKSNR